MLVKQYFNNERYRSYLSTNFVSLHILHGDSREEALRKIVRFSGFPTSAILTHDEKEIDRYVGFESQESFKSFTDNALKGENTLASIVDSYDQNPTDLKVIWQLAVKYEKIDIRDKSQQLFSEIVKRKNEAERIKVPFDKNGIHLNAYESAKFKLGDHNAFIDEFPKSRLIPEAYLNIASRQIYNRNINEAADFFKILIKKYPNDVRMLEKYVFFCVNNKLISEQILTAAQKVYSATGILNHRFVETYSELLFLDGNEGKALKIYDDSFIDNYSDNIDVLYSYASFWSNKGSNLDSALRSANILIGFWEKASYYSLLSRIYSKQKKYPDALRTAKKATKLSPDSKRYKTELEEIKKHIK